MAVKIGSARMDEYGKATGGKAGDQTGKEVSTQDWYLNSKGWVLLRAKDPEVAVKIAQCVKAACANNNIGYDQYQRTTLYDEAAKVGFDCSKVTKAVETDCSQLIVVACAYAGINIAKDTITSNLASRLVATGKFDKSTGSKWTQSSDYLRVGDILVTKTKGHTVAVLTDGPKAYENDNLGDRPLKFGDVGDDVQELQGLLIGWDYSCGKYGTDGEFGSSTKSAVLAWQYDNGLPETGIVDADDYAKIDALNNPDDDEPEADTPPEIQPEGTAQAHIKVSSGNTVNVRTAPNSTAPKLGVVYLGELLPYTGLDSSDGWHNVLFNKESGWISGKYTTIVDATTPPSEALPPPPQQDAKIVIWDTDQHSDFQNPKNKYDWAKIATNVDLLIMRCGATRTETNPIGIGRDDDFAYVAKKCKEYGIPMGVFYYGKVKTAAEARKEADKAFEVASPYNPLFYVYDVEEGRLTDASINAWADQMRKHGVKKLGMYIGHNYYTKYKDTVPSFDFIWIPRYGLNDGTYNPKYKPNYPCDMHQYTSVGRIPGCADNTVDLNRLTGSKPLSWFLSKD